MKLNTSKKKSIVFILPTVLAVMTVGIVMTMGTPSTNRLYCSYSTKNSEGGCFFKDMRLYDQRKVSDMHCAPTSAAMGLSAITMGGLYYYTNSWTKKNFVYKSEVNRIKAWGSLMSTSSSGGTSGSNIKKYKNREADIVHASGNVDNAGSHSINDAHLRSRVIANEADILTYGHYKENCVNIGSKKACSYDRNGGHVVAVNGYYYTTSTSYTTHFYDPWNAAEKVRDLTYLPNLTTFSYFGIRFDGRTYGNKSHYVYRSGANVKIIDHINGIKTN